ncbi:ADP-ribosylation factor family/Signal recognition particle receptor beta subunit/50S ribosome-binding GTPase/Ras of Complex, Roc, domain of DAPkinase/Gtr1/RagA G protein conserved region/Ras family/Elongation factor Tu GTP binding domain containing protein, putative [Angomonas deanei]|uniref:Uncharacterized protein n=1 Tax=Angomonas deanei TaxID=59799 RepID=A0A7G2C134_9TRYP|nr:ADP-ribosylation factor family/Signal recognition particle receptor beta subunit/50S ribosome-binding GTPase/Ras of Complex, Roc, domain of DAPkinase/Gtr1/RagA G protein conserved region/Ras family/Elongation factor Tu GTP binding domain containing protein, putative [Angomonas deanei]
MGILEFIIKLKPVSKHAEILLLGLDNAGKTSLLNHLSDDVETRGSATQGFQIKTLLISGVKLNVFDMGGTRAVRYYWRQYYGKADVVIFVIDAADGKRVQEAKEVMEQCLEEEKLAGVPFLIFANKQDLIGAMSPEEMSEELNLTELHDRSWQIEKCSAKTGEGISEGITWVMKQIRR